MAGSSVIDHRNNENFYNDCDDTVRRSRLRCSPHLIRRLRPFLLSPTLSLRVTVARFASASLTTFLLVFILRRVGEPNEWQTPPRQLLDKLYFGPPSGCTHPHERQFTPGRSSFDVPPTLEALEMAFRAPSQSRLSSNLIPTECPFLLHPNIRYSCARRIHVSFEVAHSGPKDSWRDGVLCMVALHSVHPSIVL